MPSLTCPVCQSAMKRPSVTDFATGKPVDWLDCPVCGRFGLEAWAANRINQLVGDDRDKHALLRYGIAKIVSNNELVNADARLPLITREMVEHILAGSLPSPGEQANMFVLWLGKKSSGPGEAVAINPQQYSALIGSKPGGGIAFIVNSLKSEGLIEGTVAVSGAGQVHLTQAGWKRYEELQRSAPDSRTAFMAMRFGKPVTDRLFRDFLKPAVALTGFELRRMDDKPKAGLIDQLMELEIRTSRFLVAELTHGNRGAYWEAGFARGLGKHVFYLCEADKFRRASTHFDTNHHYTIQWSASDPQAAAKALKVAIRATLPAEAKLTDG